MNFTSRLVARNGGLNPPPEVILNWPKANRVDPEEKGWAAHIILLILMGITFLIYIARMWARLVLSKNAGLDDILISLAMLPLLGLTISNVLAIRAYGFQWHSWDQTADSVITTREIAMSIELNNPVSTTLIKVSILYFYRRMAHRLTNQFIYWVWGTMVFCIIYGILFIFLIIFTCTPLNGFFHYANIGWRLENKLTCRDKGAIIVACAIISTVRDFIICMLIWNLKISKRQKFGLCGIFGIGLITCVCGILRTYYATYFYYFTYDITWVAWSGWIWTTLEAQLAVICASVPSLKVFFAQYFTSHITRAGYGSGKKSYGNNTKRSQHLSKKSGRHSDLPLDDITVSRVMDVTVEERENMSQKSDASTRGLTTQQGGKENGFKTVCAAFTPGSRDKSRSWSRADDIEAGRAV